MHRIGDRVTVLIAGNQFPGIIVSEVEHLDVTLADGRTIPQDRADVISLRTTNPEKGEVRSYHTLSNENLRFTPPRFGKAVVGLDSTEGGEKISLAALAQIVADSISDFQKARIAARQAEPEVAL
jgi:hypothetical protein